MKAALAHWLEPSRWRRPEILLLVFASAMPLGFTTWQTLLNNFAVERAAFTGAEIGVLQSLREVPGFLAFAVVFVLLVMREQALAYVSLALLGVGTALTGLFPSVLGLYCTTVIMSLGFHYLETVKTSLALQWLDKGVAAEWLGRMIGVQSLASIATLGAIWVAFEIAGLDFAAVYLVAGGVTAGLALLAWRAWPTYPERVVQHRRMILRSRYWLYYALTFLSGARRQIFIVFAGFLMVEKFGFDVAAITALFLVNAVANVLFARRIGRLVGRVGERAALAFEYAGLIVVFTAYAFVDAAWLAAGLYVVDHFFFALAIAIKTYFQKIADPADMASSAGVAFTINHVAAVVLPAALGVVWLVSPAAVFLCGTGLAVVSLVCALNVPRHPEPGNEVVMGPRLATSPAPAGPA